MKLSAALAVTIVGASASFVAAPSVAALSDCASGSTCIRADNDFKGDRQGRPGGEGAIKNVSSSLNDRMDS